MPAKYNGFYCQKVVGDAEFSIDEYNQQVQLCKELGIPVPPEDFTMCENQCTGCRRIVANRQAQTRELIKKQTI